MIRASRLAWTIIRPTAYMKTWSALLGEPLLRTGKTRIIGKGTWLFVPVLPLPMMRLTSVLMRLVNPTLARQIQAGVVMNTQDMSFDPSETGGRYRSIPPTGLAEVVRRDYAD